MYYLIERENGKVVIIAHCNCYRALLDVQDSEAEKGNVYTEIVDIRGKTRTFISFNEERYQRSLWECKCEDCMDEIKAGQLKEVV